MLAACICCTLPLQHCYFRIRTLSHCRTMRCRICMCFHILSPFAYFCLCWALPTCHRFVPVRGATAELSLDCVATHGWQPRWIHSELTLGKLARRFQLFVVGLLQANHIPIRAGSSLHLSEFEFNRMPSIYLHKKFMFPDRKKFRSQTSDNMDRWKAEMGRVREEKRRRKIEKEKVSEERKIRRAKR